MRLYPAPHIKSFEHTGSFNATIMSNIRRQLRYNIAFLRVIGLWTFTESFASSKPYFYYNFAVTVLFMGLFNLSQFINLFFIFDQLELFATCAYTVLICLMASVKARLIVTKWPLIFSLNQQLESDEFQPRNAKQKRKAESTIFLYVLVYFTLCILVVFLYALWIVNPLLLYQQSGVKKLPYLAWYPWNWTEPIFYEISYVHQTVSLFYICFTNANLDLMTSSFMVYVAVECDILADIVKNLYQFTGYRVDEKLRNKNNACSRVLEENKNNDRFVDVRHLEILNEMENSLIYCVVYHKKILQFAEGVAGLFNIAIFIQFAASLVSICMTLFQLSVLSPTSTEFLVVALYQIAILMQLLIYTWFGNEVMLKSTNISSALYESQWMDCSPTFKKHLHFFILRTQKPVQIYAIDFFVLSVATFTSILRASWSAFAVLRQVNNK